MGFLKSLSQSIKRSAIQQPTEDTATDFGFALPDAQSFETDVDTAGIKRPSGQGEIARRERRRSSTIGVSSQKSSISDDRASPPLEPALAYDVANFKNQLPTVEERVQSSQNHNEALGLPQSPVSYVIVAPLSNEPSFRPSMPRGIIVTPSSPRKPESKRDTPGPSPAADGRSVNALKSSAACDAAKHGQGSVQTSPSSVLQSNPYHHDRYLGIGRPLTNSPQFLSEDCRPNLLTVNSFSDPMVLTHRSTSLPVRERKDMASRPNSPQDRAISFTSDGRTRFMSSMDDSHVGSPERIDGTASSKTIRKTRSFSDVLSRNRKGRMETDSNIASKSLITWNSTKKSANEQSVDNGNSNPPSILPAPNTRKKSGNILKSAVDMFQFRKARPAGGSVGDKESSSTNSPMDHDEKMRNNEADGVATFGPQEPVDALPKTFNTLAEGRMPSTTSPEPTVNPMYDSLNRVQDGFAANESGGCDFIDERYSPAGQGGDPLELHPQRDLPPAITLAEPPLHVDEARLNNKLNLSSRSRSGATTPVDWEFKRPQMGPRAQSTSSTACGKKSPTSGADSPTWRDTRPASEVTVSRSATIKAVNTIRPRPSSDISAVSSSVSLRNSPQSSVDGFGQEASQPVSILRSDTPSYTPPPQSITDSPSVSFVGGTPRISISSTSSQGESAKDQARARRFTSTSQENIRNSLPVHNPKVTRPRSSTLFSSPPVWLASATLASPDKKRSTLMRRLSAGLIGTLDEKDKRSFQTSPQELSSHAPDYFGEPETDRATSVAPKIPDRDPGETTVVWMARLSEVVKRTEIAAVLASKHDLHFREALTLLLDSFNFDNLPLDIALRRFLLEMVLPREAQQIDRVLEAFARRYNACHPGLFRDADHAYILAFSLIMLHTDVYNRNNKQKMTKAEYVRNTRLEGVSPAVLEVFHENTCHSEFVFAGDGGGPGDSGTGNRPRTSRRSSLFFQTRTTQDNSGIAGAEKGGCRLQAAVAKGDISHLQIPSSTWIPKEDPMSYIGSWGSLDREWAEGCFQFAPAIDVVKPAISTRIPGGTTATVLRLKVIKAGLLSRKDDFTQPGKRSLSRRWRSWSVILTNTQLIFLKDAVWALTLNEQIERLRTSSERSPGTLLLSTFTDFKPDEVIGLTQSAAVYDRSYTKYENAFRLAMPHGREYLLQASDKCEMNEWVSLINWSAASKTLGIPTTLQPSSSPEGMPQRVGEHRLAERPDGSPSLAWGRRRPQMGQAQGLGRSVTDVPLIVSLGEISVLKEFEGRSAELTEKVKEELRLARNLELLVLISRSSQEHITSLLLLTAENIRRWRAELARLNVIHIRLNEM